MRRPDDSLGQGPRRPSSPPLQGLQGDLCRDPAPAARPDAARPRQGDALPEPPGRRVEGTSIRSTERITGAHRDTITRLLGVAGAKAEALLNRLVHKVEVKDIQADEIWAYVQMKEKTKVKAGIASPKIGDAYTFVGFERTSKVVLAWHLGRRTSEDSHKFMTKLDCATSGRFQLTTDGFEGYPEAVEARYGSEVDYAQLIKSYGKDLSDERRYSPPSIIGAEKRAISGSQATPMRLGSARHMSSARI